ncbi:MAG TPA: hypothetical protein VK730_09745 [Solirubrobacteraceae bacterium]|nr:hypothetical protein [Solirubrobacteraceae bacterium]
MRSLRLAATLGASAALAIAAPLASATTAGATAHATSSTRPAPAYAFGLAGHTARALSVDDTGHLHLLKAFGSVLLEEGAAAGTLPGLAKVRLLVGSTVLASFTIQTKYGTIYGSGRAALHSSGRYASFGGSLSVSHGTGSYAHAHGSGKLYGVIDRRTSALTVQTVGTLSY